MLLALEALVPFKEIELINSFAQLSNNYHTQMPAHFGCSRLEFGHERRVYLCVTIGLERSRACALLAKGQNINPQAVSAKFRGNCRYAIQHTRLHTECNRPANALWFSHGHSHSRKNTRLRDLTQNSVCVSSAHKLHSHAFSDTFAYTLVLTICTTTLHNTWSTL